VRCCLKRVLPVAACFILIIAVVLGFNIANGNNSDTFPVMKAYALDANNELKEYDMPWNKGIKLKEIELGSGYNGFLFAVEKDDKKAVSDVDFLTTTDYASNHEIPHFPHDEINSIIEPYGMKYFFYMPDAAEKDGAVISVNCYNTDSESDITTEYDLVITRENGEYMITLMGIKSFVSDK